MVKPSKGEVTLDSVLRDTLAEQFGASYNTPGMFGIELEAEGNLDQIATKFWKTEVDGSLRNGGLEFILKKPVDLTELGAALDEFVDNTKGFTFAKSIRTSCHVHVNMQPFKFREIYAVIGAYWLFEDILVELCGPERVGNLFCLRASDAQASVQWITESIRRTLSSWNDQFLLNFHPDTSKYAALNLSSVSRFGSLEFRSMRGIYTKKEISQWVNILNSFITQAKKDGTPQKVYQIFKDATPKDLVDHYFGEYADVIKEIPGWKDSIKKSSMFLAQLAYMAHRADNGEFKRPTKPAYDELVRPKATATLSTYTLTNTFGTINWGAPPAGALPVPPPWPGSGSSITLVDSSIPVTHVEGEATTPLGHPVWTAVQEQLLGDA